MFVCFFNVEFSWKFRFLCFLGRLLKSGLGIISWLWSVSELDPTVVDSFDKISSVYRYILFICFNNSNLRVLAKEGKAKIQLSENQ